MLATMLARSDVPELPGDQPSGKEGGVISVDGELTSLSWLQKPGVLTSMCTALTGSPHRVNKLSQTRAQRRPPRQAGAGGGKEKAKIDSERMFSVILNVRNKKYNGEDAQKPPLSFAAMIFMSLESSPTKTLPVKEIYEWIQWKFPFYRSAAPGWKNSVRHNLSLNKCFKKVSRGLSKSKSSSFSKGGLWTVDADYRRSLLEALKRSPYHPYHSYFTPPLSPSSSCSSLENLDPAERDAALTMCMIGGGREGSPAGVMYAVCHDHCYAKRPPKKASSSKSCKSLSLAEVAAAAEMILEQDKMETEEDSSDREEEEDEEEQEEEEEECLTDSGYGGPDTSPESSDQNMEELGADALLALSCAANSP